MKVGFNGSTKLEIHKVMAVFSEIYTCIVINRVYIDTITSNNIAC